MTPMNHAHVEEHHLVDGYLAGRLSESERDAFEAHYFDCAACLEQLEAADGLRAGMLQAAAEDVAKPIAAVRARLGLLAALAAWSRRSPRLRSALAGALLLLVALLPALWLAGRNRSLERQLSAASAAAERQRSAAAARLPGPEQALGPQVNVPLFLLAAVRGAEAPDREPVNRLPLSSSTRAVILAAQLAAIEYPAYRAALTTASGREVWQAAGLHPDSRDTLVLLLPSAMLQPGDYRLTIEGMKDGGPSFAVAAYPFRVVRRP